MTVGTQANDLQNLFDIIQNRTGLLLTEAHRAKTAQKLLQAAYEQSGARDYAHLHNLLVHRTLDDPLWVGLIEGLTIGETYFYRNAAYVNALQNRVIPIILRQKRERGQRDVRIWSAGCSTGEELYTLAMILRDQITDLSSWRLHLLGTDINEAFLKRAKQAVYRPHSFRTETPQHVQRRWFTQQADGYHLKPEIRSLVRFRHLNLTQDTYPSVAQGFHNFDLIMCRNVTIYFENDMTHRVLRQLQDCLTDGGWLVIGHAEAMLLKSAHIQPQTFENAVFYQYQARLAPTDTKKVPPKTKKTRVPSHRPTTSSERPTQLRRPDPSKLKAAGSRSRQLAAEWCDRAKRAADKGNWDAAMDHLNQAEAQNNLYASIHYLRALIFRELGQPDGARRAMRKAIYCDPDHALAHFVMGELHEAYGDIPSAVREWKQAHHVLRDRSAKDLIPDGDDLSVEILRDLIDFKLKQIGA